MSTKRSTVPTIEEFVSRCERYCAATGRTRSWLSKELFQDTFKIQKLATDPLAEVGVRRMDRAVTDLENLERASNVRGARRVTATAEAARG